METPTFINEYKNSLNNESCDYIINWFETNKNLHIKGKIGDNKKINLDKKNSTDIHMNFLDNSTKKINELIYNCIVANLPKYKQEFWCLENKIQKWHLTDDWNIQRYFPTEGYFTAHCESSTLKSSHKMLVWMIYLNDILDGGGTSFPFYNKTINAEQGKLIFWPAGWTHLHHGVVSPTETKYIATGWFNFIN